MMRLDIKAFGFALGVIWGGLMFILGVADMLYFWGNSWGRMLSVLYVGYRPTILGSIVGGIWGFVYASVIGFAVAWLYNRLAEENRLETDKKIREMAKKIWEKKGKPVGTSLDDWREAEKIVKGS